MRFLCIRPSVRLFTLGSKSEARYLVALEGAERVMFGPLSDEDNEAIKLVTEGKSVALVSDVVGWLLRSGLAEIVSEPVVNSIPGWPDAWSRQLSAYAVTFGIQGALRVHDLVRQSHVLVVGLGGIGCNVLQQLLRIGVSTFTLIDGDAVELSNLNRQVLYQPKHVGSRKVDVAKDVIETHAGTNASVSVIHDDFLNVGPHQFQAETVNLAVVSADSNPVAVQRHCVQMLYPRSIPYGFASYSGHLGVLGPLVFFHSRGCGCCNVMRISLENVLEPVEGPGAPCIPPSSAAVNAVLSGLFVDRWIRSLGGRTGEPELFHIHFDSMNIERRAHSQLMSCPICGHHA